MFNDISSTYDRTNTALSLGIHRYWRRKLAQALPKKGKIRLLDCATGTCDQIISLMNKKVGVQRAVGIDLAREMLKIGKRKLERRPYSHLVELQEASIDAIPYPENSFDCATVSFGIRNVPDVSACLKEIYRVLRKDGKILILEFSLPSSFLLKKLYLFYLRKCLPKIGGWLSKNAQAYHYLNETIESFPYGNAFSSLLGQAGFTNIKATPLTGGVATLYEGDKA
ncbi:MAG: bifunctional demethylmenaquinone methyltransferase/2-methoxy-6-polyprenyl-1,4-benzoquinol methylase UbiE [Rhabdochlamydiaceae bacterium]|jgi:demethylmenaquinone methyltransferase/2-methoxy-6-polyprenyl-1,4-benzoquinol methylase